MRKLIFIFLLPLIIFNANLIGNDTHLFSIYTNLPLDENGYFELEMINGSISENNTMFHVNTNSPTMQSVYWDCDTKFKYRPPGSRKLFTADIIKYTPITDVNGLAFALFSPPYSMVGDTVAVWAGYKDSETGIEYSMQINIILKD